MRGLLSLTPSEISNARRIQISGERHSVRTTEPGVVGLPKPPVPLFQPDSSNLGSCQPAAGASVVYRQVWPFSLDDGTTVSTRGGGRNTLRLMAVTRSASGLMSARSYVRRPFTSTSTSVVCV